MVENIKCLVVNIIFIPTDREEYFQPFFKLRTSLFAVRFSRIRSEKEN